MFSRSTSLSRIGFMLVLLGGIVGCAANQAAPVADPARPAVVNEQSANTLPAAVTRRPMHERAAITAIRQVGTPYRYGGADSSGFDCSGLVHFSYRKAGKKIPRTTGSLWKSLRRVETNDLRVGDVLFFRIAGKVSHVGLYLGERRFVHAPQSGRQVSVAQLDAPFYKQAFIGAGRP